MPQYLKDLLPVSSQQLVERYNRTLGFIGIAPTTLSEFHIDGMGWSPEIAVEKGTQQYLSHGEANPLAIILTPDQQGKPLYAPFTSFDTDMITAYFETNLAQIADITRSAAIYLDFDQGLSTYQSPQDLLLIRTVTVRSSAGDMSTEARRQAELVAIFMEKPLAWFDNEFRSLIIDSAKTHGDLRSRTAPKELEQRVPSSFYAAAFGGVFVLRAPSGNTYLVLENAKLPTDSRGKTVTMHLSDPELVEQLMGENLIDIDLRWYKEHPETLKHMLDFLQLELLSQEEQAVNLSLLNAAQIRQRFRQLGNRIPAVYFELEQLVARLEAGYDVSYGDVSTNLARLLLHPHMTVKGPERDVIWQLLLRLNPVNPARLYRVDKALFFELYQGWTTTKQTWVSALLGQAKTA